MTKIENTGNGIEYVGITARAGYRILALDPSLLESKILAFPNHVLGFSDTIQITPKKR
jgi:hypothetical protein